MIDLVGHFGSRLSYATISEQIAQALLDRGELGRVTNLDDRFTTLIFEGHKVSPTKPSAVLMISDPQDYMVDMAVSQYGRGRVAIFACPNTDTLDPMRAGCCYAAGRVYTPSDWCGNTIERAPSFRSDIQYANVCVMPLGVDEPFAKRWVPRYAPPKDRLRLLHVTTDGWWPGRKGTEELLQAWRMLGTARHDATLTIHCLPKMYAAVYQELGDLKLLDDVKIVTAPTRGSSPEELFDLFAEHDLLVAPSRSEGFGIMPLSALVSGLPVLTTNGTGQHQYLGEELDGRGVLGGWAPIATAGVGPLSGEEGMAPLVRADLLAQAIASAMQPAVYESLLKGVTRNALVQEQWGWKVRREAWVNDLIEWSER